MKQAACITENAHQVNKDLQKLFVLRSPSRKSSPRAGQELGFLDPTAGCVLGLLTLNQMACEIKLTKSNHSKKGICAIIMFSRN